jgi:hypothetical protein
MTEEHKAALAEGRTQGRSVRTYLEALQANKPKRGRKRTPDSIKKRLEAIEVDLETAEPVKALSLRQERLDLQREMDNLSAAVDLTAAEEEFIAAAKPYGERKGITYAVWREAGVSPAVLKRAGIAQH